MNKNMTHVWLFWICSLHCCLVKHQTPNHTPKTSRHIVSPPPCSLRAINKIKWHNESASTSTSEAYRQRSDQSQHQYEGAATSFVAIRLCRDWWRAGPQPSLFVTFHPAALTISWGLEGGMCHHWEHWKCPVVVTNISMWRTPLSPVMNRLRRRKRLTHFDLE